MESDLFNKPDFDYDDKLIRFFNGKWKRSIPQNNNIGFVSVTVIIGYKET